MSDRDLILDFIETTHIQHTESEVEKSHYYRIRNGKLEYVRDNRVKHEDKTDPHHKAWEYIDQLSSNFNGKDSHWLHGHSQRTSDLAGKIGVKMGLSEQQVDTLIDAGLLHDIGKLGIGLIDSPKALTPDQVNDMHSHSKHSAEMLEDIPELKHLASIVRHHHERMDGTGYPDGLTEDQLSLETKIITVADAFDAITSDRPYHTADTVINALHEMRKFVDRQFDSNVVDALISVMKDINNEDSTPPAPVVAAKPPVAGWFYNIKNDKLIPLDGETVHGDWLQDADNAAKLGVTVEDLETDDLPEILRLRAWPEKDGKFYISIAAPYTNKEVPVRFFPKVREVVNGLLDLYGTEKITKILWLAENQTFKVSALDFVSAKRFDDLVDQPVSFVVNM